MATRAPHVPRTLRRLAPALLALAVALPARPAAAQLFADGFASGTTCGWSTAFPDDQPPGVACGLASFLPALGFVREGQVGASTIPEPLTARLYRPAPADTFVAVASGDPLALSVLGGGVFIPEGFADGVVLVDALLPHPGVALTATLDAVQLQATVRVLGASELPLLADLIPATATIPPGGSLTLTVVLDIPAPALGAVVGLTLEPPGAGSLPSEASVLADQLSASFDYVDGGTAATVTVTATLDTSVESAVITIYP